MLTALLAANAVLLLLASVCCVLVSPEVGRDSRRAGRAVFAAGLALMLLAFLDGQAAVWVNTASPGPG